MTTGDRLEALTRHGTAMATVRDFARRTRAVGVIVLIDRGPDTAPTMLEWRDGAPLELTDEGVTWEVPDGLCDDAEPLPLPGVRAAAPATSLHVNPDAAMVEGPIGAVASLCDSVSVLADAFGGRSVASADWPTSDSERPVTVAARPGEPAVLGVGDELFGLPARTP